ncbi:acetyl-CoA C-acetyltransferase [Bacillus pakistanensis]|uniref:Acetyl-CoA C-acetyltransferase n=1 Tax=Rossellomorea pakistanensis TaxID=992288 RepID=A0ABS2NEW2_9BACI|nr:thiolase family protein [Bacillus pakistanensis]MBM7586395.1 acetyl-CoA C-acetyltransferase [Bacillus pakistanensis]
MNEAVIITAKRTPIGKIGGILKDYGPEDLTAKVIRSIIHEYPFIANSIDDVILGNTVGPGGNLARLSALTAGLPLFVSGLTLDRQCGSGLEAVVTACRFIQAGAGDIYLAGGVESTSKAPWKIEKPANSYSPLPPKMFTRARFSPDEIGDPEMGVAAENVAEKYAISRDDQDRYSLLSHQKAVKSLENGRFEDEIVLVGETSRDECPRQNTSFDKLQSLPPVFKSNGTVTAGNACPINDGAAIVLVMSKQKCVELGIKPTIQFVNSSVKGVDPNLLGIGPIPAVQTLLEKENLTIEDIDTIEFNEAFASQVLASLKELNINEEKVNRGGGAIALGHPYGASGAILVTRLFYEMKRRKDRYGIATLGIGGGMGLAALFKEIEE